MQAVSVIRMQEPAALQDLEHEALGGFLQADRLPFGRGRPTRRLQKLRESKVDLLNSVEVHNHRAATLHNSRQGRIGFGNAGNRQISRERYTVF